MHSASLGLDQRRTRRQAAGTPAPPQGFHFAAAAPRGIAAPRPDRPLAAGDRCPARVVGGFFCPGRLLTAGADGTAVPLRCNGPAAHAFGPDGRLLD